MDQKEIEIQRALGTIEPYYIELITRSREEDMNLDELVNQVFPVATRFLDGEASNFMIETHYSTIQEFISLLDTELRKVYKWMHITIYSGASSTACIIRKRVGYDS